MNNLFQDIWIDTKNKNYKIKILFMKGAWKVKWNFIISDTYILEINDRLLSSVHIHIGDSTINHKYWSIDRSSNN